MIERLILSRFRGIRKGVIKDMEKINLLVGPNNSGKTAILEAIYWLSVCGRQCGIYSKNMPKSMDEDGLSLPYSRNAFVPMEMDLLGMSPCPRIWKRHGKSESWKEAPGSVSEDGALAYNIPHLKKDDPLKSFRLIPPQTEEIRDVEKFDENTLSTTGVFVLDNFKGIDDVVLLHGIRTLFTGERALVHGELKVKLRMRIVCYSLIFMQQAIISRKISGGLCAMCLTGAIS